MLERDIERASVKEARADGWLAFKFSSPHHRGVPDYIFMKAGRGVRFIEFKRPGGKLTRLQEITLEQIRGQGIPADVAYSVEDTRRFLGFTQS
jgi:hypothetical protein